MRFLIAGVSIVLIIFVITFTPANLCNIEPGQLAWHLAFILLGLALGHRDGSFCLESPETQCEGGPPAPTTFSLFRQPPAFSLVSSPCRVLKGAGCSGACKCTAAAGRTRGHGHPRKWTMCEVVPYCDSLARERTEPWRWRKWSSRLVRSARA